MDPEAEVRLGVLMKLLDRPGMKLADAMVATKVILDFVESGKLPAGADLTPEKAVYFAKQAIDATEPRKMGFRGH